MIDNCSWYRDYKLLIFNSTIFTIDSLQVVEYWSLPTHALSQARSTAGGSSGKPAEIRPGGTVA